MAQQFYLRHMWNVAPDAVASLQGGGLYVRDPRVSGASSIKRARSIQKFGRNDVIGTTEVPVSVGFTAAYPFLTTAQPLYVDGGNAADTSDGTGMQQVTLIGLNENWDYITETLTLAGESESSRTSQSFIRVFTAFGVRAGSGEVNAAAVVIKEDGADATLLQIATGKGRSQNAMIAVPRNYRALIVDFEYRVEVSKAADFWLWQRDNTLSGAPRTLLDEHIAATGAPLSLRGRREVGHLRDSGALGRLEHRAERQLLGVAHSDGGAGDVPDRVTRAFRRGGVCRWRDAGLASLVTSG